MTEEKASKPGGSWSQSLGEDQFSLSQAVGGVRGMVESLLPGVVFVVVFVVTHNLAWTVGSSASISVLFCIVRLIQRQPLTQALAGLIGVLIGVVWAAGSGKTENYFAWGLVTNAVYAAALLISLVIRQPLGAWALMFLWSLPRQWLKQRSSVLYRRSVAVTWVWLTVFAIRLAAQVPLYFSGAVAPLGVVKLVLGLPLFGLAAWLTWVLLRNQKPAQLDDQENTGDFPEAGDLSVAGGAPDDSIAEA